MLRLREYTNITLLSENAVTSIYRGVDRHTARPVILKTLHDTAIMPKQLQRLRHEYAILSELANPGIPQAIALLEHQSALVLVQEDIGGVPLTDLISAGPCPLERFFPIARALVTILDHIHRRQIIHRDLKPSNIILNPHTGQLQIIDFGLASRLSREHPQLAAPTQLEGTLAYLAPEQTGRMNRTVDYRADFYALGITLYELLTGQLPFVAHDALEWVHCHIARQPRSPDLVVPRIPTPLADVVLKLLAKLAEDRYQSAAGLRADLLECQQQWATSGTIMPFVLGQRDYSDRFQLSQKLYGREAETAELLQAFKRVTTTGQPEVILLAGYAGIGKSVLVAELHPALIGRRGYFISGKCDQYQRDIPYAPIAAAFQGLVQRLLAEPSDQVTIWREQILDAVGAEGQLIIDLIPQIKLLIGAQPPLQAVPLDQAQHRLHTVFQKFVSVFTSAERPLVLFLDDLQWIDAGSRALLTQLLLHASTRYLLVLGAYRDNEVDATHPFMSVLDTLRRSLVAIQTIVLQPLAEVHVRQILAETLHCTVAETAPLAQLVYVKTRGNPFFVGQFVTALYHDQLLIPDPEQQCWRWDLVKIQARRFTDNVVVLMLDELHRLPAATQQVLALAGLLGNYFDLTPLALVSEQSEDAAAAALWPAIQIGLLVQHETQYRFLHDRVQEAAYALSASAERIALHARIGRVLLAHTPAEAQEEHLFAIVTHLNQAAPLLTDLAERQQVVQLNLRAGMKAQAATVYADAVHYLSAGIELLPIDHWRHAFELSYSLYLARAESELVIGHFEQAQMLLDTLLAHSSSSLDRAKIYQILADLFLTKGDVPSARAVSLTILHELGIDLPSQATAAQAQQAYAQFKLLLADRPITTLIDLPPMSDPLIQVAMRVLTDLCSPALLTDEHFMALARCTMVMLSLRYGNAVTSPHGYGFWGLSLVGYFDEYQQGYEFCDLAHRLLERYGLTQYLGQILFQKGIATFWVLPIDRSLTMLREASRTLIETGNPMTAYFCIAHRVSLTLFKGYTLEDIEQEVTHGRGFAQQLQYQDGIDLLLPLGQLVRMLRGQTSQITSFNDTTFDEAAFEAQLKPERMTIVASWYALYKLMAHCFAGNYAEAHAAAQQVAPLLWASQGFWQIPEYHYYAALALAALYDTLAPDAQPPALAALHVHAQRLQLWAQTNPETSAHTHALVAAEIDRICNHELAAMHGYEQAIRSAHRYGFVHHEALANELAARFYRQRSLITNADGHLRDARICYERWCADGKVQLLEQQFPQLRKLTEGSITSSTTNTNQLDALALIKSTRAISEQIVRDKLLSTLLQVVLEQAGAQAGALLLTDRELVLLAATAQVVGQDVYVRMVTPYVPAASDVPVSLLNYVLRTRKHLLLDDATTAHPFSTDPYFATQQPRSVLALPVIRQGQPIGVLYLEHATLPDVFTLTQLNILDQLAAQAAISLENAQLYEQLAQHSYTLEQTVAARTADLHTLLAEMQTTNDQLDRAMQASQRANSRLAGLLRFARFMQHEISGYAAGLEGLVPVLRAGVRAHAEAAYYRQRVDALDETVAEMKELTQRMLILTREGQLPTPQRAPVRARALLAQVRTKALAFAARYELSLTITVTGDPAVVVAGDAVYLALACYTGLRNAIEVLGEHDSAADPAIALAVTRAGGMVVLAIRDNGPGFPAALLATIAQARAQDGELVIGWSTKAGGSGLGLALMERVAQLHGGTLAVGNRADQPGAWVELILPSGEAD